MDQRGTNMRPAIIALGSALVWLVAAGQPSVAADAPDPHALQLARDIATIDSGPTWAKAGPTIELILDRSILQTLGVNGAPAGRKIRGVVVEGVEQIKADMIDARASALATTLSASELEGVLAFRHSELGQAFSRTTPELTYKIMAAFYSSVAPADEPLMSIHTRESIRRILVSQDAETHAHDVWRLIRAAGAKATSAQSEDQFSFSPLGGEDDKGEEEAFVQRVMAIEQGFYAKTFTDAQLSQFADYLEGPVGRAMVQRGPQLRQLAISRAPEIFEHRFAQIAQESCEAVTCSPANRKALDTQLDQLRTVVTAGLRGLEQ